MPAVYATNASLCQPCNVSQAVPAANTSTQQPMLANAVLNGVRMDVLVQLQFSCSYIQAFSVLIQNQSNVILHCCHGVFAVTAVIVTAVYVSGAVMLSFLQDSLSMLSMLLQL